MHKIYFYIVCFIIRFYRQYFSKLNHINFLLKLILLNVSIKKNIRRKLIKINFRDIKIFIYSIIYVK